MAQRLQMNAALFNAGKALNSVLDLDDVLDAILANALDLLGGATGSVMLVEDEESLRVVAVRGSRLARDAWVKLGESIAGRVARSREPLLISGFVGPTDYPGYEDRDHTTSSAMCVPLVNRGQLLGVLNISASSDREFDEHDLQVLSLFAEPVAAAIAKAGLYEAERAHVAQLLDTDRMKTQFVASVSHELRTPITSIRGAVAASRRPVTPEQRVELLEVIERQSLRLQAMVEEIFTAAKMEEDGKRPLLRRIDLAALVRLAALDSQVAGRPVEVEAPTVCEVRADPEAVRRIVGNLIENAAQVRRGSGADHGAARRGPGRALGRGPRHRGAGRGAREGVRALLPRRPERDEARHGTRVGDRAWVGGVVWGIGMGRRRSGRRCRLPGRAADPSGRGASTGGCTCRVSRGC